MFSVRNAWKYRKVAWKYRRLWKYRGLWRHRKELLAGVVGGVAVGWALSHRE
jgi:hypothetical protein